MTRHAARIVSRSYEIIGDLDRAGSCQHGNGAHTSSYVNFHMSFFIAIGALSASAYGNTK